MDEQQLKGWLNRRLMEAYIAGLEEYFMEDGAFRKLVVRIGEETEIRIPWFCLASYTPLMVEDIQWDGPI